MKKPVLWLLDGVELPYPPFKEWNNEQNKIRYALNHCVETLPNNLSDYISYFYHEFNYIVDFYKFYCFFWKEIGVSVKNINEYDLVDIKFLEWLKIMQFEQVYAEVLNISFNEVFQINKFIRK